MDFGILDSLSHLQFSDTVIGSATHSLWEVKGCFKARVRDLGKTECGIERKPRTRYRHTPYQILSQGTLDTLVTTTTPQESTDAAFSPSIAQLIGVTDSSTGRKRTSCFSSDLKTANEIIASIQRAKHNISDELQHIMVTEALKKKIRHRERCRINQARYREKQKVRSEITGLNEITKVISCLQIPPTIWVLAAEYLRYFKYYISSPATLFATASTFLQGIMAPDEIVGPDFTFKAQLEHWRLFALFFDKVKLEMAGMHEPAPDTLIVGTIINITITTNTLCRAFPHLNSDRCGGMKGGKWGPLATRMLGEELVMRGSFVFGWNNVIHKVVRFHSEVDMLTPMIKLVGNVRDVSSIFNNARVTPDCRFV